MHSTSEPHVFHASSHCSTSEPRVSQQVRTCFTSEPHVSHLILTCLKKSYPSRFGPLLRRSSTVEAHAVPTRPTDNSTFGTSISLIPTTEDRTPACPCLLVHLPCPTVIPSNSVSVP